MIKSTFDLEKELWEKGYQIVIGIDEAGRGPLAGPVVAAATMLRNFQFPISNFQSNPNDSISKNLDLIRDSKKLSEKQREKVFDFIHEHFWVGVGICDHHTIDRINILEASFLAMKKAVGELLRIMNQELRIKDEEKMPLIHDSNFIILVDGNKLIPNFSHEQRAIVGGDKIVKSISAASIIAKVTRDRMMLEMDAKYPAYGFDAHKGYGTKFHMEMIHLHGPSSIHRQSFEPMKSMARKKGQ